jgi:hypothetical protein
MLIFGQNVPLNAGSVSKKTPYRWQGSRDFMLCKPATQPYTLRFIEQAFSLKLSEEQTRPSDKIAVSVAAHLNVT